MIRSHIKLTAYSVGRLEGLGSIKGRSPRAQSSSIFPSLAAQVYNMPSSFTHQFDTALYKGSVTVNTGLFINGEYVDSIDGETIEYVHASITCVCF